MSILFELGDGSAACLCVQKKERVGGPWLGYWYSRTFQVNNINIGRIVISWRVRPYRHERRRK